MKILCIIPARGGSKGIPGKNLRAVNGKPLVAWTIHQALAVSGDVRVVVTTDDVEIASVARDAGAEVPFLRPAELAVDASATEPAIVHALQTLGASGYRPDVVVLLQPTSPVRKPGTIQRAIEHFALHDFDSMVGVIPQAPFLWRLGEPPVASYDFRHRPRRQELQPGDFFYRETGSIYVTKPELYESANNRLGGEIGLFIMDEIEGIDIDTEVDLSLAAHWLAEISGEEPGES